MSELDYYPVGPRHNRKALELSPRYFGNAADPQTRRFLKYIRTKDSFMDSGGLQVFQAEAMGKKVLVGSMYRTVLDDPNFHIVGITDQCDLYYDAGAKRAMLLDFPVFLKDDDLAFWEKVERSRDARDEMLAFAEHLCPGVRMGVVLQPRTPMEAETYYVFLQDPRVEVYALPVRIIRNKPKHALGNAFVLSFLASMGVQHVHFLGSNAPAVIFLLAKAASLGMFPKLSFDSATWNTKMNTGLRYLHPEILSTVPDRDAAPLLPMENLRALLTRHPAFLEYLSGKLKVQDYMAAGTWYAITNILAIGFFKHQVMEAAARGGLEEMVEDFPKYSGGEKEKLHEAFRFLEYSVEHGHDAVKARYDEDLRAS